ASKQTPWNVWPTTDNWPPTSTADSGGAWIHCATSCYWKAFGAVATQPGRSGMTGKTDSTFWLDRPTLVTGGTGLLGGWLIPLLIESGAELVCLVRDWVPQSLFVRERLIDKVVVVRGDVRDQELLERVLGEYEVDAVFHLAAQTIVGIANRNAISTFESNIAGTWSLLEACRRSPTVRQI